MFSNNLSQIENVAPKDGMRNLYFSRDRKTFVKFFLEVKTTCQTIYDKKKEEIISKAKSLYGEKINLNDFCFCLVDLKINKSTGKPSLIELKIRMNVLLFSILQNRQLMLCFLPINKPRNELKINARNKFYFDDNNIFKNVEKDNYSPYKKLQVFLNNKSIYIYDNNVKSFSKEKGTVDERQISFKNKESKNLFINEILKHNYFDINEPHLKDFKIYGDKPRFFMEIQTKKEKLLFGHKKIENINKWKTAINKAIAAYRYFSLDSKLDNENVNSISTIFTTSHVIMDKSFILDDIFRNKEKRKIFLEEYKNKKIESIIENIINYKISIKNNNYLNAWRIIGTISQILMDINEKLKSKNIKNKKIYSDIFTKEINDKYSNVLFKTNSILSENKNDIINNEDQINNKFKEIIKNDLFDDLYDNLYNIFIISYFEKTKKIFETDFFRYKIPQVKKRFELLLSYYCIKFFDMNNIDDFNYFNICREEDFSKFANEYEDKGIDI